MAAKLNPDDKELRKQASKLRNAAYSERRKAYNSALIEAERTAKASPEWQQAHLLDNAFKQAMEAREQACAEIETQIAALTAQLNAVRADHSAKVNAVKTERAVAYQAARQLQEQARASVIADFPDMVDCWGAGGWKPIEDFLPQVHSTGA